MILWGSILRAFLSTGQRELLPQSGIDRKTPHPILRIPPVIAHQLASAREKCLENAEFTQPETVRARTGSVGSALRRANRTTPQVRGGAEPRPPVTISVAALLELAAWCRQRLTDSPGGTACLPPHDALLPPAPDPSDPAGTPRRPDPVVDSPAPGQPEPTPRPAGPTSGPASRGPSPRGGRS